MSITYEDLCKQQQRYNHELVERRATLREQIRQLVNALAHDLNLQGKTYKKQLNDPAPTEPYVRTSDIDGNPCDFHQLKAEFNQNHNPYIQFGLIVALEDSPTTYPKKPVRLNITAQYVSENAFQFIFPNIENTPTFNVNADDDEQSKFAQVIEAYKQLVIKTYTI
ncbi:hypothetical protein BMT54_06290 [Pasteurellaceae bacterium 15-036681]|nr:hypothetical protein BMT54_06290 [Pasteurellaceae bacterium 15-036681]